MKTITRSKIYLLMAALILAALAIPAAAQTTAPFKGVFKGHESVNPPSITATGGGTGMLLGEFSLSAEANLTTFSGSAHWVAANGDSIDTTVVASGDGSTHSLGYITITEIHTITSGTGGFTGAQGSFTVERTHIVEPSADGTHLIFGSFHGSITLPGAAK
jgi:hypothetical protein